MYESNEEVGEKTVYDMSDYSIPCEYLLLDTWQQSGGRTNIGPAKKTDDGWAFDRPGHELPVDKYETDSSGMSFIAYYNDHKTE